VVQGELDLLWSINERLGAICETIGLKAGHSYDPLSMTWLDDVIEYAESQSQQIEDMTWQS